MKAVLLEYVVEKVINYLSIECMHLHQFRLLPFSSPDRLLKLHSGTAPQS